MTARVWFALNIREPETRHTADISDDVSVILDDFAPVAVEDLQPLPLPPGGLWDPTFPPIPEPPPSSLAWRVFFASADDRSRAAGALRTSFPGLSLVEEDVDDEDWATRSQRGLTAITAGRVIVAPPWAVPASVPPDHTLVVIEPSHGFGTGHHASTRLCLRALSTMDVSGLRVLDLGTGSGVLAMAAALRGAARVVAVDVDADAIAAARASQALNAGPSSVTWIVADYRDTPLLPALAGGWDVVLANLTAGMLCSSAARIRAFIAPAGVLIASGFDESECADVLDALDVRPEQLLKEDGWVGLTARR